MATPPSLGAYPHSNNAAAFREGGSSGSPRSLALKLVYRPLQAQAGVRGSSSSRSWLGDGSSADPACVICGSCTLPTLKGCVRVQDEPWI